MIDLKMSPACPCLSLKRKIEKPRTSQHTARTIRERQRSSQHIVHLETEILKKVWLTFINHNFGFICVCMFFFKYRFNNFLRFHTNGMQHGTTYLNVNHGRFLSLLVYSVKKIDRSGEAIIWLLVFQKGRGKIEINPSGRNKQICKHSCRKNRVCLCVSARHYSIISLFSLSPLSLSLSLHLCSQVNLNAWKNMDSCHIIFFLSGKFSPQIQGT